MEKELLAGYGINYDKGLKNCMGNTELYSTLLSMFLDDQSFPNAQAAYDARDFQKLFESLHELKGVCGNAGLTELYDAVVPFVELVRGGTDEEREVERQFTETKELYERACEGIKLALKASEKD